MGKQWQQLEPLFFGAPQWLQMVNCSHETKRRLLLGRKAMINLDSILKSRDITLLTKAHLVKAMVFPVQFSCSAVFDSLQPHGLQHTRHPCPSPTPGVYTNSCPLSWWCHPVISSCDTLLLPLKWFPASGSFQMGQFFASSGQNIGAPASASVLPMNVQDWFPLGWTGWISLQSKGLSNVFSDTTVQKHQFFSAQLSL